MSTTRLGAVRGGTTSPRRGAPLRRLLLCLSVVLFMSACVLPRFAFALNTCEEITRCSECVYDQTQGIMPPSLHCGWCESSQSCKQVNSSVLAYYGATTDATADGDDDQGTNPPTAEEMAAYRALFCEDLRERNLNGVCPDMSCAAASTTNNIYICRAPPLIALVFGCILFVLSLVVYLWMRTIRQLPWKYEPFLSDLLEGRSRTYEERSGHDMEEETTTTPAAHAVNAVGNSSASNNNNNNGSSANNDTSAGNNAISPLRRARGPLVNTTRPGSPLRDGPPAPSQFQAKEEGSSNSSSGSSSNSSDDDAPSAETASTISNPSYLDNASHNVVVAHHPHGTASFTTSFAAAAGTSAPSVGATTAPAAATGYCPICKCRQPAFLGPGEVCFWCNVARFTFVPFFIALLSSVIVIVLDFAVSLKPWFSDWYFAEVLIIAYASYAALGLYMIRHHGRAPLFFFESEAERKANQRVWSTTHDRPVSSVVAPGVPASGSGSSHRSNNNGSSTTPPSHHRRAVTGSATAAASSTAAAGGTPLTAANGTRHRGGYLDSTGGLGGHYDHRHHHDRLKVRLLNEARRNMASTYYVLLALRLRGRPLLQCFPELAKYTTQLEAMQGSPATLTAAGDAVAALRPTAAAVTGGAGSRVNSTPGSPHGVPPPGNNSSTAAATTVPVISPFAVAVPPSAEASESAEVHGSAAGTAAVASPGSTSSPSVSSGFENGGTGLGRLPPLAHLAATPPPATTTVTSENAEAGQTKPADFAATVATAATASPPPAAPAGGPIGSPAAANVPESLARQKRGETVQLLSSDFLSPQYCRALKSTLYRDEYITWCAKPNLRGVLMENEWLLTDLTVGFLFGAWMVMLSSVSDTTYTIVELSGSTAVATCGLLMMALFAVLLVIVVRQCGRLYVLTNERLITVYESVITPVTTATDLSNVRFAALYGYRGLWSKYPCLTFSWEIPATERKMPVIKSHKFPGITHLQEFLFFFRLVAPQTPFHLQQISESTKQDRQEWRLHIFLCVGAFVALPIVTIYPQAMPDFLGFFLYALGLLAIFSTLLRGLRSQQMTYAPLNIAASWAPEGDLSELNTANPSRTLPPPPAAAAAAAATAAAAQEQQPLQEESKPQPEPIPPPTIAKSPSSSLLQPAGPTAAKESSGRAVQIATPTSRSPVLRTVPEFHRVSSPTNGGGSPRGAEDRIVVNEAVPVTPAATATEGKSPTSTNTITKTSPTAAVASAPKDSKAVATNGGNSGSIAGGLHSGSATRPPKRITTPTTAAATAAANALQTTTVPVTAAVREMEESLTGYVGVGVTGGGSSANNSFSLNTGSHVGGTGSRGSTTRNSPYRRRPSSLDVTGLAGGANTGTVSMGPATAAAAPAPAVVGGSVGGARPFVVPAAAATTGGRSPITTAATATGGDGLPTVPNPPASPPTGSPPMHDGLSQRPQPPTLPSSGASRSTSEETTSAAHGEGPGTAVAIAHHQTMHGTNHKDASHASLTHVVPASLRSTKVDGHTTWGDRVGDQE